MSQRCFNFVYSDCQNTSSFRYIFDAVPSVRAHKRISALRVVVSI